jgi:hypothetical protein
MLKTVVGLLAASTLIVSSLFAVAIAAESGRSLEECYKLADSRGISQSTYGPKNPRISFVVRCQAGTVK